MKTFPFDLSAAANVARLVTITRGDEIIQFTDFDQDITIGADTWTSEPGAEMSSAEFMVDGTVSNIEIHVNARSGGPIDDADIAFGRYDGYPITVQCCDTGDLGLSGAGAGEIFIGVVGAITVNEFGLISIQGRGPLTKARVDLGEQYGPMCRADLGDARCKKPILPPDIIRDHDYVAGDAALFIAGDSVRVRVNNAGDPSDYANIYFECTGSGRTAGSQPSYAGSTAIGHVTSDGSAQFTTRNSFLRYAQVDAVLSAAAFTLTALPDSRASVDGWFTLGAAIVRSGRYSGYPISVRVWTAATLRVDAWEAVSHMLDPGTWLEIHRGCDKTEATCFGVFDNIVNRRAETFVPGRDAVLAQA